MHSLATRLARIERSLPAQEADGVRFLVIFGRGALASSAVRLASDKRPQWFRRNHEELGDAFLRRVRGGGEEAVVDSLIPRCSPP